MPDVAACLEQCKHLIEKGHGTEPCKLILPRREAARRKENAEGQKRLIKVMTPEEYGEWNGEFDRYTEAAGGNPIIARSIMLRCLKQLSSELITTLSEDWADDAFEMGRDRATHE